MYLGILDVPIHIKNCLHWKRSLHYAFNFPFILLLKVNHPYIFSKATSLDPPQMRYLVRLITFSVIFEIYHFLQLFIVSLKSSLLTALLSKRIVGGITLNVIPIKFIEYYYSLNRMPPFLLDRYNLQSSHGYC